MSIKSALRKLLKHSLAGYELYLVYQSNGCRSPQLRDGFSFVSEVGKSVSSECDTGIVQVLSYSGEESKLFCISDQNKPIAACAYLWGRTFEQTDRRTWKLRPGEAKLVQINTDPGYRGLGLAPDLINLSATEMRRLGFETLYARIWHSNVASVRAFEKAGWKYRAFVIRLVVPKGYSVRIQLPALRFLNSAIAAGQPSREFPPR